MWRGRGNRRNQERGGRMIFKQDLGGWEKKRQGYGWKGKVVFDFTACSAQVGVAVFSLSPQSNAALFFFCFHWFHFRFLNKRLSGNNNRRLSVSVRIRNLSIMTCLLSDPESSSGFLNWIGFGRWIDFCGTKAVGHCLTLSDAVGAALVAQKDTAARLTEEDLSA